MSLVFGLLAPLALLLGVVTVTVLLLNVARTAAWEGWWGEAAFVALYGSLPALLLGGSVAAIVNMFNERGGWVSDLDRVLIVPVELAAALTVFGLLHGALVVFRLLKRDEHLLAGADP